MNVRPWRWAVASVVFGLMFVAIVLGPYLANRNAIEAVKAARLDAHALQATSDRARDVKDCAGRNQIRAAIARYLDLLAQGSANQAEATLASKTSSVQQRDQADATLRRLPAFTAEAHRSFAPETCPHP